MAIRGVPKEKSYATLALVLLTVAVYAQIIGHGFIALDDLVNIRDNLQLQQGINADSLRWAFTTTHSGNWHPVTWISHMVDIQLFGLNPSGHHATSLAIHLANVILLYRLLVYLTGATWRSFFVAALFAIHPLHVESVAWAAERKDLLSTLFLLLTLLAYGHYLRLPSWGRYVLALSLFATGLMCKPMLVSLPAVLLLLDFWPMQRLATSGAPGSSSLQRIVLEKVPFALLAAGSCAITYYAQSAGNAVSRDNALSLAVRLQNALIAYATYLFDTVWPMGLSVFYPLTIPIPVASVVVSGMAVGLLTLAVIHYCRCYPYLLTGWFWYLITLIPTAGIIQVGLQARADRYTYIPLIGIFICLSWGMADLFARWRLPARLAGAAGSAILLTLAVLCFFQVRLWRDTLTLFNHALKVTRDNYYAALIVGNEYRNLRDHRRAIDYYYQALNFGPNGSVVHMIQCDLATSLGALGRYNEAIEHFHAAIRANPQSPHAYALLAQLLEMRGNAGEAELYYRQAMALDPNFKDISLKLAMLLARKGNLEGAYPLFLEALRQQPDNAEALNAVGIYQNRKGDMEGAEESFTRALRLRPTFIDARRNLELLRSGQLR